MVTKSPFSKEFQKEAEAGEYINEDAQDNKIAVTEKGTLSDEQLSSPIKPTSLSAVSQSTPPPLSAASSEKSPKRKGSLINDIRELVTNQISAESIGSNASKEEDEKRSAS